ncbi:lysophospholipid acyltransferase family protein [Nannocystis bainbridge]|uniref:Lysophospholipid acyltransferase family protein n=1 Tax=Nannocystis bainbridge TaxID=2995303 RepID=A0ABT5E1C6_9BACT|nr:lysophospholipid acyltransferase family protein [Nannocystis bainbridge]MDC0719610.1 lysophospholipid acyltransferase family protein [Nannocystis bainbridge]
MLRRVVEPIFGVALRIFFRRIELDGLSRVPADGPVMFVLNHPNALIDPAFLLCLSPRPVAFLAKAPLFKTPVLGAIVRAFDSIPVYRRQDEGGARVDNGDTFRLARELLLRGRAIAIFPEGTSHSDPDLKPLKTGAARIALGTGLEDLTIIPAGLFYTAKARFRSDALVYFGAPLSVPHAPLDERGEPPAGAVASLTRDIDVALRAVTLHGDDHEILSLVERTSDIFAAASEEAWSVAEAFELRQKLLTGHARLRARDPARLDALIARVLRYERDLAELGLGPDHLAPETITFTASLRYALRSLFALGVVFPLALAGTAIHYPAYRASGMVAARVAGKYEDMVATGKLLAAMAFFPLTWVLVGLAAGQFGGLRAGLVAGLLFAPLAGWAALSFWERFATVRAAAHGLGLFFLRRHLLTHLSDERRAIRAEILALAEVVA